MKSYKETVGDALIDFGHKIKAGTCVLNEDEAILIVSSVAHIALNKQLVADRYGVSVKTIERKEKDEIIPPSHIALTSKKQWWLDELIKFESEWNQE